MQDVYVIDAVRSPVGRLNGCLADVRADDLLASTVRSLLARNRAISPEMIEDFIAGDANQAGEDCRNVARLAGLLAGLPVTVGGNTVNRLCGSGMQAIMDAARAIACGEGDFYLAGGVESMSRAPWVRLRNGNDEVDSTIGWRFTNQKLADQNYALSMGKTADLLATRLGIKRAQQDEFALSSHEKYFRAKAKGIWAEEIVAINNVSGDEPPRQTGLSALERLKPVFHKTGTVTAGNASGLNDGAAALILAGEKAVKEFGLAPLARIRGMAVAGVEPLSMGMGPVPASQKALKRAGLQEEQIDLWEVNESFAVQVIACIQALNIDPAKVNINGGSIAIGNPLGSNAARICVTLLHEMRRSRLAFGAATTCIGVGQGSTIIFEGCR